MTSGEALIDAPLFESQPQYRGIAEGNPTFTWVRLAQRIPVRIRLTEVPPDVLITAGMTCTVTLERGEKPQERGERPQLGIGVRDLLSSLFLVFPLVTSRPPQTAFQRVRPRSDWWAGYGVSGGGSDCHSCDFASLWHTSLRLIGDAMYNDLGWVAATLAAPGQTHWKVDGSRARFPLPTRVCSAVGLHLPPQTDRFFPGRSRTIKRSESLTRHETIHPTNAPTLPSPERHPRNEPLCQVLVKFSHRLCRAVSQSGSQKCATRLKAAVA